MNQENWNYDWNTMPERSPWWFDEVYHPDGNAIFQDDSIPTEGHKVWWMVWSSQSPYQQPSSMDTGDFGLLELKKQRYECI